jgi:hypothetical protein
LEKRVVLQNSGSLFKYSGRPGKSGTGQGKVQKNKTATPKIYNLFKDYFPVFYDVQGAVILFHPQKEEERT